MFLLERYESTYLYRIFKFKQLFLEVKKMDMNEVLLYAGHTPRKIFYAVCQ